MNDRIECVKVEGLLTLRPRNNLVAGSLDVQDGQWITNIQKDCREVVLDLSKVILVDSVGISTIIGMQKDCVKQGVDFRVVGVSENVYRVFKLFRLSEFFSIEKA